MGAGRLRRPDLAKTFLQAVEAVVRAIPRGQTLSYAAVALRANRPGAARAVARALHRLSGAPWWRVIRSDSTLAPKVAAEQGRRLKREGVEVAGRRIGGAKK